LLVASSYQPVKLDYIYFLFYEFVHDCFDLGKDVEAELDKALFFDLVHFERCIWVNYLLDNLPVEDSEAIFSHKLRVWRLPALTVVDSLQLLVENPRSHLIYTQINKVV